MKRIQPTSELRLGHRAYHVSCSDVGHVLAASQTGIVSIVGPGRELIHRFETSGDLGSVNLSPDGNVVALTAEDRLEFRRVDGTKLRTALPGRYLAAWFDRESKLWTLQADDDGNSALVKVYDSYQDSAPVATCKLDDPFGASEWSYWGNSSGSCVPIWAAAGQDGQTVYFLSLDKRGLSARRLSETYSCGPPLLNDSGDEFLIFIEESQLRRCSYPECDLRGSMMFDAELAEGFGLAAYYLSPDRALVHLEEGRLYTVDLLGMRIVQEVEIAGHERRPIGELYPSLAHEDGLTNDLTQVEQLGTEEFVSIHLELPDAQARQLGILVWWSKTQLSE